MRESREQEISMARFANVAFSDGSLLQGFEKRLLKRQPFSVPNDIKRYFITPEESGQLCIFSAIFGENRDIYFPKLNEELHLINFTDIAIRYLQLHGFEPFFCSSEDEAREGMKELIKIKKWPCYFFASDTTGEKEYEEFFTEKEKIEIDKYTSIGVIKNSLNFDENSLDMFMNQIEELITKGSWTNDQLVKIFYDLLPDLNHQETGKYLDEKM